MCCFKGSPKLLELILWGLRMTVQYFMAVHPIPVEIFQSGPKLWDDR